MANRKQEAWNELQAAKQKMATSLDALAKEDRADTALGFIVAELMELNFHLSHLVDETARVADG